MITPEQEMVVKKRDGRMVTFDRSLIAKAMEKAFRAELGLDSETYDAVVTVSIAGHLQLPVDTVASIASAGLMGGKYVRLEPGKEKKFIAADGRFAKTKDFRSLEDQVGEIIFLATGGPK